MSTPEFCGQVQAALNEFGPRYPVTSLLLNRIIAESCSGVPMGGADFVRQAAAEQAPLRPELAEFFLTVVMLGNQNKNGATSDLANYPATQQFVYALP